MKLNVAIIGAGTIVPDFLLSSTFVEGIVPYTILGQENDRPVMEKLASQYNIQKIVVDYDVILKDPEVNIVYIALPNHLHYDYARRALESNKNVIIEKPFCSSLEQAQNLFDIADKNNVFLFEAMPNIHFPNFKMIKEKLQDIGDIKIVELNTSKYSRRYDDFKAGQILPAFDRKKDGGALMDMGVYNLHFLIGLFGKPTNVKYYPNMERDVDTSGIMIIEYPTFKCSAIAAKDCSAPNCIVIQGDRACIHSTSRTNLITDFNFQENEKNATSHNYNNREIHERLAYEIEQFYNAIIKKDVEIYSELKSQTLNVMGILEQIRCEMYE